MEGGAQLYVKRERELMLTVAEYDVKCEYLDLTRRVFDRIPVKGPVSCKVMISGLVQCKVQMSRNQG